MRRIRPHTARLVGRLRTGDHPSMLSLTCPKCGASCRIPLAEDPVRTCHHCGLAGPIDAPVAERVRAAFRALSDVADRDRQFRGLRGAVASSATATVVGYFVIVGVMAVVAFLMTRMYQGGRGTLLPATAAILTFVLSVPILVSLVRSSRRLRSIARALPPLRPGEPSACRVCGGAVSGTGVVRCSFCSADNIVDRAAIARSDEAHRSDAEGLEDEVRSQAAALGETRGLGFPLVFSVALLPLPIFVLWMGPAVFGSIDRAPPETWTLTLEEEGPSPFSERDAGHAFCAYTESNRDCTGLRTPCVTHPSVHPRWLVGKTTTDSRQVAGVHDNFMYGFQVSFADGKRRNIGAYDRVCVRGDETPAWKQRRAVLDERERLDKAESAAIDEKWRKLMPDGGVPRLQIHDIPLPPIPIGAP